MPSSEEADKTAKQLLLSWPDPLHTAIMQHAAGAAGQNRLRSYSTRVYICTFYHTLICVQKPGHKHKLRSDWCTRQHYKCIFLILRAGCNRMTRHVAEDRQPHIWKDKASTNHLHIPHFFSSLCCVQSCQLNHEGTVQRVSKSRINVIIWPIKLWNEVLHKLFCF